MRILELDRRIIIFDTAAEMQAFAAGMWADRCREAVRGRGFFTAAVSGGRTPEGFFRELSDMPDLPWDRTHLFLADERLVPPMDADSNYRLLNEILLTNIKIPAGNVHPAPVEFGADEAARLYERTIRDTVPSCNGNTPCFDLMVLGMGEDGHTASLFPGSGAPEEQQRLVRPVSAPEVKHERITMTLPLINSSRSVIFLVSGESKARALSAVGVQGDEALPASRVAVRGGRVVILCDAAAGRLLPAA
jgi:6-phosphogluconolactonase